MDMLSGVKIVDCQMKYAINLGYSQTVGGGTKPTLLGK
jgi:hypothetical protein